MTPEHKELVQRSWSEIAPRAEAAAKLFEARLHEQDPRLAKLSHGVAGGLGRRLIQGLGLIIQNLDRPEASLPLLRRLGRTQAQQKLCGNDQDAVASVLLWTLKQVLGAEFTPKTWEAWVEVYTYASDAIREAARAECLDQRYRPTALAS